MLTMVIPVTLLIGIVSCSALVEERKEDSCTVKNDPTGRHGVIEVMCSEISFKLFYDNSPDGRDPLILKVSGVEASRVYEKRTDSYILKTGDHEVLEGWRYEEVWKAGDYKLKGYEYFVSGGTACYEEEEGAVIKLLLKDREITLLDFYQEDTDCGGA